MKVFLKRKLPILEKVLAITSDLCYNKYRPTHGPQKKEGMIEMEYNTKDYVKNLDIKIEVYAKELAGHKHNRFYSQLLENKINGWVSLQDFLMEQLENVPSTSYEGLSQADELALDQYYSDLSEGR